MEDSFVSIMLTQKFDFLELLSLKITQEDIYKLYKSPYGILAGRVIANNGFGVPNAKVSVFIPLNSEDESDDIIRTIYPYKSVNDLNEDGVRYNLLEDEVQSSCHVVVGTFPSKRKVLDNDEYQYVYEKYYKFTTTTNESGDYLIYGVPAGYQICHMDVDLSDIGFLSIKPYDLIAAGYNENLFFSNTKFNAGTDLDSLVQIQSLNTSVYIKPLWGNSEIEEIGINRLDFKIPIQLTPTSLFVGSIFTDQRKNAIARNCRPRARMGNNCELGTGVGRVEIIRRISEESNIVEFVGLGKNSEINNYGVWAVPIPMNLNRVVTDEFGNLIPSEDPTVGIPTSAKIRCRISMNEFNSNYTLRTANYLVPNMYNRFEFGDDTLDEDFFELQWRKVYTVSNYIPRYQKNKNDENKNFIGIKNIGQCETNSPFPYNRADFNFNPLYVVLCIIVSVIAELANIVDLITNVTLTCDGVEYEPDDWGDCVKTTLAEQLGVIVYEFYNDWINGTLYAPLFKYKVRFKKTGKTYELFCDYDCREISGTGSSDPHYKNRCKDAYIVDRNEFDTSPTYFDSDEATEIIAPPTGRGVIIEKDNFLYYSARHDVEIDDENAPDLTVDGDGNGKDQLLFATNIIPLGSSVNCDIDGVPFFFNQLEATTYRERETTDDLFELQGCSGVNPNSINQQMFLNMCQIGMDILTDDEDGINPTEMDADNSILREYLCTNFPYYTSTNIFSYSSDTYTVINADGDSIDITNDVCVNCDDNSNYIRRLHPYYFYFGLKQGNTAWDLANQKYFQQCN